MKQILMSKMWPYAAMLAYVVGVGMGWMGNGMRLNAKISELNLTHQSDLTKAFDDAMAETARMQKEKDDALIKAQELSQRNAADAASATRELGRLRNELQNRRSALSSATHTSLVEHANTLSDVFEDCIREYTVVARQADGHAADARILFDAWQGISK
jgi:hypothetical protein